MLKKIHKPKLAVGVDEAGRGSLAGPVVAGAVYISRYVPFTRELRDSKKLSADKRNTIHEQLIHSPYIKYGIGTASVQEIDEHNILQATYIAMRRAVDTLGITPQMLYIDGDRFGGYQKIEHKCIKGGDDIYRSIAAASIIAKVHRDRLMQDLDAQYPDYGFGINKGYGTAFHRAAIRASGLTPVHRTSFKLK